MTTRHRYYSEISNPQYCYQHCRAAVTVDPHTTTSAADSNVSLISHAPYDRNQFSVLSFIIPLMTGFRTAFFAHGAHYLISETYFFAATGGHQNQSSNHTVDVPDLPSFSASPYFSPTKYT